MPRTSYDGQLGICSEKFFHSINSVEEPPFLKILYWKLQIRIRKKATENFVEMFSAPVIF